MESRGGGWWRNLSFGSGGDVSLAPSPSPRRPARRETTTPGARRGAEAWWRDIHEASERLAREVHGPHVSAAHDGIEFVVRDSHHQIAPDDAATHPTEAQEGETTEHLAFGDVVTGAERLANAIRELLVVRHRILLLI